MVLVVEVEDTLRNLLLMADRSATVVQTKGNEKRVRQELRDRLVVCTR